MTTPNRLIFLTKPMAYKEYTQKKCIILLNFFSDIVEGVFGNEKLCGIEKNKEVCIKNY